MKQQQTVTFSLSSWSRRSSSSRLLRTSWSQLQKCWSSEREAWFWTMIVCSQLLCQMIALHCIALFEHFVHGWKYSLTLPCGVFSILMFWFVCFAPPFFDFFFLASPFLIFLIFSLVPPFNFSMIFYFFLAPPASVVQPPSLPRLVSFHSSKDQPFGEGSLL